jgi:hypothetical protein
MSRTYRYPSFVPSHSAALHVLAVAPLNNHLLSFDPNHSASPSLGVYHILICLSLLLPPFLRCLFLCHRWQKGRAKLWLLWNMFQMEPALPIEDGVFLFTRWTLRTVSLRAAPSVVQVRAYTAFRLVNTVRLLMPVPIIIIA